MAYLEEHVWRAGLHLRRENGEPQLLRGDGAAELLLSLILLVEGFELIAPYLGKAFRLSGMYVCMYVNVGVYVVTAVRSESSEF